MKIRNNTPSFGMAFRAPSKSEMGQFAKYITDDFKVSSKMVKKALEGQVELHSKDKHFDFYFEAPKRIQVEPTSEMARQMCSNNQLVTREVKKGLLSRYREKYSSDTYRGVYNAAGTGKKFVMNLIHIADAIRTRLAIKLNPSHALPDSFIEASKNVAEWEKLAEKEAVKAAAIKAAKAQKAAAKAQRMNSAIEEISSVFEPKTLSSKGKLEAKD